MFDMSSIQGALGVIGGGGGKQAPWMDDDTVKQAESFAQAMQSGAQAPAQPSAEAAPTTTEPAVTQPAPVATQTPAPLPAPQSQADGMVQSTAGQVNDKLADVEDTVAAFGGGDGQQNNFMNSNLRKTVKKVASAIAAFYTGGLSSAAMNVGSGLVSENNPKAGAIAGAASKAFGGGGGGGFGGF